MRSMGGVAVGSVGVDVGHGNSVVRLSGSRC